MAHSATCFSGDQMAMVQPYGIIVYGKHSRGDWLLMMAVTQLSLWATSFNSDHTHHCNPFSSLSHLLIFASRGSWGFGYHDHGMRMHGTSFACPHFASGYASANHFISWWGPARGFRAPASRAADMRDDSRPLQGICAHCEPKLVCPPRPYGLGGESQ